MKKVENISNLILIFFSSLLGLFLAETFSWVALKFLYYKSANSPKIPIHETSERFQIKDDLEKFSYIKHRDFRLMRPLPYKGSNYYDWFIKETLSEKNLECNSKLNFDVKGFNLSQSDIPNCRGITIINGWRITTNQPKNPLQDIYIFGGSTVMNVEVPNEFTIASYLQRNLNSINSPYKVNNRGFTTVTTNQQNEFLYKTDIKKGDIVIYYDGGNNQWQGVVYNSPKGTIIESMRKIRKRSSIRKALSKMHSYKFLSFLKANIKTQEGPSLEKDNICKFSYKNIDKNIDKKSNIAFELYKKDLIDAAEFVRKNGGKFFHFYQPNLFSNKISELTLYEKKLANTTPSSMVPCGSSFYLGNSSIVFSRRHSELINSGIISTNLSKIFSKNINPRLKNEEFFLDWIHVTERGNKIIADAIFKKIDN